MTGGEPADAPRAGPASGGWRFAVALGVEPSPGCRAALEAARDALEAARDALPGAILLAAHVPGDEAWPRVLDKEDAIEACRHGLVALRAVEPGVLLTRAAVPDFAASAALLATERGYLVPSASATRRGRPPRVPRLRLLTARHWTREERLWQLFRLGRRAGRGERSASQFAAAARRM